MTATTPTARSAPWPTLLRLSRSAFIWGGFASLVAFGLLFLVRDSLKYLEWSEAVYRRFWPQGGPFAIHVLTASVGLIVAPIQFSTRPRKRWPRAHRTTGWIFVICTLVSAGGICARCRPSSSSARAVS